MPSTTQFRTDLLARLGRAILRIFFTALGKLKVFPAPLWIVYDPGGYKVNGQDIRRLLEVLQPGDILLRGYDTYLDSFFIRRNATANGPRKGLFTHAALYLGELDPEKYMNKVAALLKGYQFDSNQKLDQDQLTALQERMRTQRFLDVVDPGSRMVIQAVAEGVMLEDILTFVRCDQLMVLRLPDSTPQQKAAFKRSCAVRMARIRSLGKLGAEYDFDFEFVRDHHFYSCAELVYYAFGKSLMKRLGIRPAVHSVRLGDFTLAAKSTVAPDDFARSQLIKVFASHNVTAQQLANIGATLG